MNEPTATRQYHALREQIEGIISEARVHTRRTGEWARVETYWHIGDSVLTHLGGQPRAEYGERVVANLSRDLGMSAPLLGEILLFRRCMPVLYRGKQIGWTHIRAVLRLPTQEQRYYYLRAADRGAWTTRQLREAIETEAYRSHTDQPWAVPPDEDPHQGRPLQPRFGDLHTYRVVPSGDPTSDELFVDLGFGVTCQADLLGLEKTVPFQILTVSQDDGALTSTGRTPSTRRYTYVAWVQRVIDGDTLIAVADLGFGHQTRPLRFRLRGIDCPELKTLAGRNARAFVQEALSQVGFIVLTTHSTDAYGRYLADIRYLPEQTDPQVVRQRGRYLNKELLDEHLARRYSR